MLSDMTFLLLPVGLKRSFGLIGESAITLHMQYNQSETRGGYRIDIGYSVKEALLCFALLFMTEHIVDKLLRDIDI